MSTAAVVTNSEFHDTSSAFNAKQNMSNPGAAGGAGSKASERKVARSSSVMNNSNADDADKNSDAKGRHQSHNHSGNTQSGPPVEPFVRPKRRTIFFPKGNILRVEPRFVPNEIVGHGAYGIVCSAQDLLTNELCCVKKIERVCQSRGIARRTLRELIFLRHFAGHENIMNLVRVMRPSGPDFSNVYVVSELMETDLACVIRSPQTLTDDHVQFFIYQILRGVKYMHSANVIHRDMKPRNLLVNSNCDLKVCDFGLARFEDDDDRVVMSDYVATRWYRSPEIIERKGYSKPVDMWAIGCILGELLCRKPLFPGNNEIHQLHLIRTMLGMSEEKTAASGRGASAAPSADVSKSIELEKQLRSQLERTRPNSEQYLKLKHSLDQVIAEKNRLLATPAGYAAPLLEKIKRRAPKANPLALDLMVKLLAWDPAARYTAEDALEHQYLQELHVPDDEPRCRPLNPALFEFERRHTTKEQLREYIWNEILKYNAEDKREYPMNDQKYRYEAPRRKRSRRKRRNSF